MQNSIIQATNLTKVYHRGAEDIRAIDGVNINIAEGEFVSFVGPSGSGKTTLLHILGCLETPTEGSLTIGNNEIYKESKYVPENRLTKIRRQYFGYIFQKFYLIPTLTVRENILLPYAFYRNKKLRFNVDEIARQLGIDHRLQHLPKEISGGEMQRVAIARSLVNEPKILLADEPTGNLDSKKSDEIADILVNLNNELSITIILVTHNPDLAQKATRTIELLDGKLSNKS